MATTEELPPGWQAHWNDEHQRYLFVELETGQSQWEHPSATQNQGQPTVATTGSPPPTTTTAASKRRHYATNQAQAYYGDSASVGTGPAVGYGGVGGGMGPAPTEQPQQLFTPGLQAGDQGGFAAQQQQQPAYFQPQQTGYPNTPNQYGQQGQPQMNRLTDQFGKMGFGGQGGGPRGYHLQTTNLLTTPVDPIELLHPPPEIHLPPNSALSNSPFVTVSPAYQRCTINAVPANNSILSKSKLPFALVMTPYKTIKEGEPEVPVVTDMLISRCRRCRGYINPYVQFIDGGSRWRCPMCTQTNETPHLFDWDQEKNVAADRWQRAELNHSIVEYIAPANYSYRQPQPPVYAFVIDVSQTAVQSGMLATTARTLLENLHRIPNTDDRGRVAIIGVDNALHFFTITPDSEEFQLLIASDIEDVFLPRPAAELLVSITAACKGLEALLAKMNELFAGTHTVGSAMGPGMQAAFMLVSPIGGKVMVLTTTLPSLGQGSLKNREDPKLLGTSKESSLLLPAATFYKTFAIQCSRAQVSIDMFLFSSGYTDVASLACLPHYTSGQTYFYPAFNAARSEDAVKFAQEFGQALAMPYMFEAITRVRATKGLRLSGFHGNFFVQSSDLLAMPAVPQDQSYTIEIAIDDPIQTPFVLLQTGLLHSTCTGERRVRVITTALPVTSNISELYASADPIAITTYLANKAVERTISSKLEDARDAVTNKLIDILKVYKDTMTGAGGAASSQLAICENLKLLPILTLGLLKHVGLRQSAQIPSDLRAHAQALLTSLPHQLLIPYLHPTFYALHSMPPECGTVGEHGLILPPPLPLTSERLERHGLFLIEDGQTIFLWVGKDSVPQLIMDVFDLPNYETLRSGKHTLPLLENSFSQRVNAIIAKTREMRIGLYYPHLYVVKEDGEPPLKLWALSNLIQDRFDQLPNYQQFLNTLKEKINAGSYS